MARGKKSKGKNYTSKGERNNVSRWLVKARRRDYIGNGLARTSNQMNAFLKGKNVMLTIPNPVKSETNKPFIRVSAKEQWRHTGKFVMKDRS